MTGRTPGLGAGRSWHIRRWSGPAGVLVLLAGLPGGAVAAPPPAVQVGANLPVSATDARVMEANNSPLLVEDPTERRFVALASRIDQPDFGCALHLSGDGGRYWVQTQPVPKLPAGAEKCYGPELAFDRKGTLYFLFVGLQGVGNSPMGAFLVASPDRGRTFSSPRPLLGRDGETMLGPYNYMVRMAIDRDVGPRGRIHLAWLHAVRPPPTGGLPAEGNPILSAYSDDGGETFSKPVQVSDPGRRRAVAPSLAIGGDGAVHVAYYDLQDDAVDYQGLEGPTWEGDWSLVVASSRDGGKRFGRGVVVERRVVPPGRVMLIFTMPPPALAAEGGNVYAAWPDARHGDPDVLVSRSTDAGRSWSAARRLNDDRTDNGVQQSLPSLAVAPDGRLDAVFYDRRDDPDNTFSHVYHAFSTDGGRRFSANTKLTSRPSDTRIGRTYEVIPSAKGLVEFGSRLGLLSRRSAAVAAWPDTRNGAVDKRQDIFSTIVVVPDTGADPGAAPWLVVAAVTSVGGALGSRQWRRRRNRIRRAPSTAGR